MKRTFRQMLAILMALCLLFTLVGCADGEVKAETETETNTETDTPPAETTTDPAPEASEEAIEGEPTADAGLQIERSTYRHVLQDEATNALLCEVEWDALQLTGESAERYSDLAAELRKENNRTYEQHGLLMEDLSMMAYDAIAEQIEEFNGYTASTKAYIHRADEKILSVRMYHDEYTGGAHPNYGVTALNYDVATGEVLALDEVITDVSRLADTLADKIRRKYDFEDFEDLPQQLKRYSAKDYTWTLGDQGITFWFSPYEIAPYAAGLLTATITYDEWPTIFVPEYVADNANWTIELPYHQDIDIDFVPGDLKVDHVRMVGYADAKGILELYLVVNDGEEYPLYDYHALEAQTRLVCKEGTYYLYMKAVAENDAVTCYVYQLTDEGLVLTDTVPGGEAGRWETGINGDIVWTEAVWIDPIR